MLIPGDVGWHDALHGLLSPLEAVALDLVDLLVVQTAFVRGLGLDGPKLVDEAVLDLGQPFSQPGGLLAAPDGDYSLFDFVERQVRKIAVVARGVAPGAYEVLVLPAVALHERVEKPGATATAVHGAVEVVEVAALPHTFERVRIKDGLHSVEGRLVDDRRMCALVLDALPGDIPDVVAVAQDVMQLVRADRALYLLGRPAVGEVPGFEGVGKPPEAPLSRGIGGKGPADQVGTFVVDLDGADLSAVDVLADVPVADRSAADGAAAGHLLGESLGDLLGQVARVELCDRTHDAVHEGAGWALVDVLGRGYEGRAGPANRERDLDVIDAVASEAVELVHEDVVDLVALEVRQHPLQVGPVG